ncbi:hypothetical protein QDR37_01110 [Amnibacterium sp. CER49]|uniref:hypothetical protein n=1 Tax=Amnibacterium sp. CER49 TaxID=3039161 RepID=UPI00244957A9|nr:hypothetical protein [Amnibacterium sp. CER49]MDH2442534.1 hypothetical protein [Amnibacterium sp. CER49]
MLDGSAALSPLLGFLLTAGWLSVILVVILRAQRARRGRVPVWMIVLFALIWAFVAVVLVVLLVRGATG